METAQKSYPENYPSDALAILDAMSFSDGKDVKILGSMSIRSQQYAGDYDAYEVVKKTGDKTTVLKQLAQQFKEIIKRLGRMPLTIGDIKAGTIEEWRVIPKSAGVVNGKVVGYSAESAKAKIDFLRQKGVISKQEEEFAYKHLKPTLSAEDFLKIRKELRFNLIRWSVPEVLAGQKRLRDGGTYTLEEAFDSPTITKLDTIGFVQNNKYTDFSMIYEFECNGEILNPDDIAIERSLKEDILYYRDEGMPFKALKRVFALAKFKDDTPLIKKLIPILNSDLGRLYSISADLETLINLKKYDVNKVRLELDQMKGRIGNVFAIPHFGNTEHSFIGHLNSALKAPESQLPQHLVTLQELVDDELRKNTPKIGGTHRIDFLKDNKLEDKGYSLPELAEISSVPLTTLQEVYNRGIGAYKTNPSSVRLKGSFVKGVKAPMSKKLSKEQWAMARVYSFLDGNPKHDNDLRVKAV